MGLLDKVKQVAGEAAEAAKKGASQVQSKVEQTQVRKRADEAAKQLGYLIAHERGGTSPAAGEVDRLVGEIETAEAELERMRAAEVEGSAIDPVCGMTVDIATATLTSEHAGTMYYFSSRQCLDRFTANPSAYADANLQGPTVPPPAPGQAPEEATGE